MKPIFGKAPPLGIRLLIAIFASIALILADGRNNSITKARSAMETAIGGLYYLANSPRSILDGVSENLVDTNKLQIENKSTFDSVFLESKIVQEYNRGWKKYIKKECVMMIISVIFAVAYFLLVALVAALVFRAIGKIFELFDGYLMYH